MTAHKQVEAAIFDIDGTLLDTRELIRVGYVETLLAHGFKAEAEAFEIGTLSKPIRESYLQIVGPSIRSEILEEMLQYHEQLQNRSTDLIVAYEGLHDLVAGLKQRNIKTGVFTSGSKWHVIRNFGRVGVNPETTFGAMVTADDKVARKPAPDGILLCLERLGGLRVSEAVVIGDHQADMEAGKAARVKATIGLMHGLGSKKELEKAGADYIIPSLAELLPTIDKIEASGDQP